MNLDDVDDFLDKVNKVSDMVNGLKDGKLDLEDIDK